MGPKPPKALEKASWATGVPVMPSVMHWLRTPEERMTSAVMVRTTKVSMKTPTMATSPCCWGLSTLAIAWEWGVEPMPASLENRPRATP